MLVAELPVERFVGAILPGLPGIDERRLDLRLEPAKDRARDELRAVVGPEVAGRAMHAHELREHLDHPAGADAARHVDGQALARELVDDRQTLQRPPIGARVEYEIVRPHVIEPGQRERPRTTRGGPPPWPLLRDLQSLLAPQAIRAVGAHPVALALEEDPNHPIAVAGILPGQRPN